MTQRLSALRKKQKIHREGDNTWRSIRVNVNFVDTYNTKRSKLWHCIFKSSNINNVYTVRIDLNTNLQTSYLIMRLTLAVVEQQNQISPKPHTLSL